MKRVFVEPHNERRWFVDCPNGLDLGWLRGLPSKSEPGLGIRHGKLAAFAGVCITLRGERIFPEIGASDRRRLGLEAFICSMV